MQLDTQKRLDEIKERLKKTTAGPWFPRATDDNLHMNARYVSTTKGPTKKYWKGELLSENESGFIHDELNGMGMDAKPDEVIAITLLQTPDLAGHDSGEWDENTEFIANSREDIPYLLNIIEAQEEYIAKIQEKINSTQ